MSSPTQWTAGPDLPVPNHDVTAAVLAGHVHVVGGCAYRREGEGAGWQAYREIWRLRDGRWEEVARLSHPRIFAATAVQAGCLHVIGGERVNPDFVKTPTAQVERSSPDGRVDAAPPLPLPLRTPVAGHCDGLIQVCGLLPAEDRLAVFRQRAPGQEWEGPFAGPASTPAMAGCASHTGIYLAAPRLPLWHLAIDGEYHWQSVAGPVMPRSALVAEHQGRIWIMGGRDLGDGMDVRVYCPRTNRWTDGPRLPEPLAWGAAASVGDRLVVAGGAWDQPGVTPPYRFSGRTWILSDEGW